MSDGCNTLPSHAATLWPSLMCFGKLVRVRISHDAPKVYGRAVHPLDPASNELWRVRLNSGVGTHLAEKRGSYALLSLVRVDRRSTLDNVHIEGLFLHEKSDGVFQRIGRFSFSEKDLDKFYKYQNQAKTKLFTIE